MENNNNKSIYAIITKNLALMTSIITLTLGLFIVLSVGHELVEQQTISSYNILNSLENAHIKNKHDWNKWRKESSLDIYSSYLLINDNKKIHFTNFKRKKLNNQPQKVFFLKNIYYVNQRGIFYKVTDKINNVKYVIWNNLNEQVFILLRVIEVTLILLILALIISPIYIRWLAKRLTDPIVSLADESALIDLKKVKKIRLSEPDNPTEINKLSKNFNVLLAELNKREDQKQIFLMNATHELKTPIATIYSHAQLIQRHGKDHPETVEKSIKYIEQEAKHMNTLVSESLTLSRIDRTTNKKTKLDLSKLLNEQALKFKTTFDQKVEVQITDGIVINSNAEVIDQILNTLMSNAAKFSPKNSKIILSLISKNNQAVISVADNGPGISQNDKDHIFERFYRSDKIRGTVSGTGLGLAIAKEFSDNIESQIEVCDNKPNGSIFSLIIDK